jgi:hypothetical protein
MTWFLKIIMSIIYYKKKHKQLITDNTKMRFIGYFSNKYKVNIFDLTLTSSLPNYIVCPRFYDI